MNYCIARKQEEIPLLLLKVRKTANQIQYNGSKDDLDWRADFKYLNFIIRMKKLRFMLIKGYSVA